MSAASEDDVAAPKDANAVRASSTRSGLASDSPTAASRNATSGRVSSGSAARMFCNGASRSVATSSKALSRTSCDCWRSRSSTPASA